MVELVVGAGLSSGGISRPTWSEVSNRSLAARACSLRLGDCWTCALMRPDSCDIFSRYCSERDCMGRTRPPPTPTIRIPAMVASTAMGTGVVKRWGRLAMSWSWWQSDPK